MRGRLVEVIPEGAQLEHLVPSPPAMLVPVVEHVTPLAEGREIAGPVVAAVAVEIRAVTPERQWSSLLRLLTPKAPEGGSPSFLT